MNLTPEERAVGQENFYTALGSFDQSLAAEQYKRRDFLKSVIPGSTIAALASSTGCPMLCCL